MAKELQLQLQLQHQYFWWMLKVDFLLDWLVWSLCYPRDFQESSPKPQFKSINFSVLSLLYGPTLISIRKSWETLDLTVWTFVSKVMSLLFKMLSSFSSKEKPSFSFMAAVTICSDFRAQENSLSLFPFFLHLFAMKLWDQLPWSSFLNVEL